MVDFKKIGGQVFAMEALNKRHCLTDYKPLTNYLSNSETAKLNGKKHDWYRHGGNDTMPNVLLKIYQDSGIHSSIINIKSKMIAGGGLEFYFPESLCRKDDEGIYRLESVIEDDREKELAEVWAKNVLVSNYIKEAAFDLSLYGGYYGFRYVERGRDRKTLARNGAGRYLRRLRVEPFLNMRLGTNRIFIDEGFGSEEHYISNDFTANQSTKVQSYETFLKECKGVGYLPAYTGEWIDTKGIASKFVGNVTGYRKYYPTPAYESRKSLNYICIDYLISENDLTDIKEGFSVDHIIVRYRKRNPDDKLERQLREKDKLEIKESMSGSGGHKSAILWVEPDSDNKEPIKIIEIPHNNKKSRWDTLREERTISILNAHGITAEEIAGLPANRGGLSSQSDFLITAMNQFYHNVIAPEQRLIEDDLNEELAIAGFNVKCRIKRSIPLLKTLSDELIKCSHSINEIRELGGKSKLTEDELQELREL